MKLRAKGNNDAIIEKFNAQSSKTAKYAKSIVKKRENSELKNNPTINASQAAAAGGGDNISVSGTGTAVNNPNPESEKSGTAGGVN